MAAVAAVAAVISYRYAYQLVTTHGETGLTARLLPLTVDGLILAASMLILDASRRRQSVPPLAHWCLGAGIAVTIGANLALGLGQGPSGQWSARSGSARFFELLMTHPHRTTPHAETATIPTCHTNRAAPAPVHDTPAVPADALPLEQTVRAWHHAGHSQRVIARDLGIDPRKIKRIIDHPT